VCQSKYVKESARERGWGRKEERKKKEDRAFVPILNGREGSETTTTSTGQDNRNSSHGVQEQQEQQPGLIICTA
jgi:hypothetical protein